MPRLRIRFLLPLLFFSILGCVRQAPLGWPGLTSAQNRLYATLRQKLVALDPASGTPLWEQSLQGRNTFTAPPVRLSSGLVIVGDDQGRLLAFHENDGTPAWTALETGHPFTAAVVAYQGRLYAANGDGTLYVLDREGRVQWRFTTQGPLWAAVAVEQEQVYLPSMDHHLYVLDAATGALLWKQNLPAGVTAAPLVHGQTLYLATLGAGLQALDRTSGHRRWQALDNAWLWHTPVWTPAGLAVGDMQGRLTILDGETGKARKTVQLAGAIVARPLWENGRLYVVTEQGGLYAVDPTTGDILWKVERQAWAKRLYTSPVAMHETLYLALQGKTPQIIALDTQGNILWTYTPQK